ncbi:MAG: reverse transcriptase domain-containing protein, partial [Rickettsia endosymbiont of Ixodes persulcatus]|nr:reverse transcriptase domain-containing protein [Rickettsia endosymbiont of Ixodes persulcatus]
AGVPQGSILGPLPFNVYINDIVNIDHQVQFVIYADDTSLFISATDADVLIYKANNILRKKPFFNILQ